jgi:DeoR/GlpR family transcriptional regulator of sugar metabolism
MSIQQETNEGKGLLMIPAERQNKILQLIRENGKVTVNEIGKLFDVSEMTVRRDLRELDSQRLLRRVHGGAVNNLGRNYEPPLQERSTKNLEAKHAIGCKAAQLVHNGDSIALDVGTTTLEVARCLGDRQNLTILTSSIPIANEIISKFALGSELRLILTGGIVRAGELSMIGHFASRVFEELHVDKAFIGVAGLTIDGGLTEYNLEDALVKRVVLQSAKKKIAVIDSSKLGRTAFTSICPLSCIDTIVTDENADKKIVEALRESGTEVLLSDSS